MWEKKDAKSAGRKGTVWAFREFVKRNKTKLSRGREQLSNRGRLRGFPRLTVHVMNPRALFHRTGTGTV